MKKCLWILLFLVFWPAQAHSAHFFIKAATDQWFPLKLVDEADGYAGETGKTSADTTVEYATDDATAWTSYADGAATWKERGDGHYGLQMGADEFASAGKIYTVRVEVAGCREAAFTVQTMTGTFYNMATTDDGGAINVTNGKIDEVATLTGHTAQTGDAYAVVTHANYGLSVIEAQTDDIGIAGAGLSAIPWGGATWAAGVWETNISAYAGAGHAGTYLKTAYDKLPTNYLMGSSVVTAKDDEIDASLADTNELQVDWTNGGRLDLLIDAILDDTGTTGVVVAAGSKSDFRLSATGIDDIWDEATAGHAGAGTTGKALTDAAAGGDPWNTAVPGAYGAGTAGYLIGTNLNATVSSRAPEAGGNIAQIRTDVDAILEAVNQLGR